LGNFPLALRQRFEGPVETFSAQEFGAYFELIVRSPFFGQRRQHPFFNTRESDLFLLFCFFVFFTLISGWTLIGLWPGSCSFPTYWNFFSASRIFFRISVLFSDFLDFVYSGAPRIVRNRTYPFPVLSCFCILMTFFPFCPTVWAFSGGGRPPLLNISRRR